MSQLKDDENGIWLKVPKDTFFLGLVRTFVSDLARRSGFPPQQAAQIEMAVDEACTNAIQHGTLRAAAVEEHAKNMSLRVDVTPGRIGITLIDNGQKYAFEEYRKEDLDRALEQMQVGGLGLYIIKQFMDEVLYFHEPEVGNVLTMAKYVSPPSPEEEAPIDPMEP